MVGQLRAEIRDDLEVGAYSVELARRRLDDGHDGDFLSCHGTLSLVVNLVATV